jgi:hypothetical protein
MANIPCGARTRQDGSGICKNDEIEGLGGCLLHVPDEFLEEAEYLLGYFRCRTRIGQPDACRAYAVIGSTPPTCTAHGMKAGTKRRLGLEIVSANDRAADRAAELLATDQRLMNPAKLTDPYGELMQLAGEMRVWKEILQEYVSQMQIERMRYNTKVGEQLRAEITLYERAIERYGTLLVQIARLNLDARLVGIRQQTANMMERALEAALQKTGTNLAARQEAKEEFHRQLKIVA